MKSLQNNFTTPEQSKRMLELGVPEWTADCLIKNNAEKDKPTIRVKEPCTGYYFANDEYIPCWSVGRLIEIYLKCYDGLIDTSFNFEPTDSDNIVELVIEKMANKIYKMKFSKLEE